MPIDDDLQTTQNGFPPTTLSAEEAMFMWETHGKEQFPTDPQQLETYWLYRIGKEQRDFHVTEWRLGVKQRLFVPEEFYGVLGMVLRSEFRGVFGRDLDLHLLAIQARELQEEIRFYENLLTCDGNNSTSIKS